MADAPVDALLVRVDDLAKGWLLELVDQYELARAPAILAGGLASSGPRLCEAVIRALATDTALVAIERGGPLEPLAAQVGRIAAAAKLEDVSRAVDALMAVLWSAIRSELRDPDAELVSELAERLAHVIEAIRGAALNRFAGEEDREGGESQPAPAAPEALGPPPVAEPPGVAEPARMASSWPASPRRTDSAPAPAVPPGDIEPPARETPRRRLDEMSADSRIRSWPGGLEAPPRPNVVRSEALWIGAIDDEIDRAEDSGAALSLLLVELEDADRVLAVEDPGEASMTFRRFAQAVRTVVRRQDILACESDSRAWIIAPGSDRAAAQALGARIEHAVRAEPPWRGAPMTISVGLSVLGEDGRESATLMDVAEEARFAATAGGVGLHALDPAAPEPPPPGGPQRLG